MGEPYEKPQASRTHEGWVWNDRTDSWELPGSDASDCVCAQYAVYKILGLVPDPDLVVEEVDLEVTNPSFLDWLERNEFDADEGGPRTEGTPPRCGCGDGQQTACVVLYRDSESGDPMHVAVFDPQLCDWGGKLSGPGKIVRYCEPQDYLKRLDPEERDLVEMVFYCNDEAGPYVSDEAIGRGLRRLAGGAPVEDEPVPEDFGLFRALRRLFGWLLAGTLFGLAAWLLWSLLAG